MSLIDNGICIFGKCIVFIGLPWQKSLDTRPLEAVGSFGFWETFRKCTRGGRMKTCSCKTKRRTRTPVACQYHTDVWKFQATELLKQHGPRLRLYRIFKFFVFFKSPFWLRDSNFGQRWVEICDFYFAFLQTLLMISEFFNIFKSLKALLNFTNFEIFVYFFNKIFFSNLVPRRSYK